MLTLLSVTMCPMCEKCTTWKLGKTCSYTKVSYMFDNPGTVFFAVFMSFWGKYLTNQSLGIKTWFICSYSKL